MKVNATDNRLDPEMMIEIDDLCQDIVKFKLPDDSAGFSLYLELNHKYRLKVNRAVGTY